MSRPRRLLIVEDDPSLRSLYEEEFREEGYEVECSPSGEEAVRIAREKPFDAAVLDIRLGGMDGIAAMQRLLVQRPGLAVVLNTAYTSFKSDFATWAADRYVVKSSDLGELKSAVRESILQRRGAKTA